MNLKFKLLFLTAILSFFNIIAQSSIKGNKIVITQNRDVTSFTAIEVMDDVDVYLFQGSTPYLNVEADENLHESIHTKIEGSTLKIYLSNKIRSSKKLNILITVTDSLNTITAKGNSNIYADARLIVRSLVLNMYDNADATLKLDADNLAVNGFKNTDLKLDVFSINTAVNITESCELKLEGEIENLTADIKNSSVLTTKGKGKTQTITATNNGSYKGEKFIVNETTLTISSRSDVYVNTKDKININASDTAEITSFGKPEFNLIKFDGKAKLHKK
ncbi:MAG: DUF2807 domain-containing protein [Bacteroidetes bacterium]|jgi:hypothetical protein|nr:DUF2807 domain-containing protein [Bacteroidota bacterium]